MSITDNLTHVLRVTWSLATTADRFLASRGSVPDSTALAAKDVRAIQEVLVVRGLVGSAVPVERGGALRVSDATFHPALEHRTTLDMAFGFLLGIGSVPTETAMVVGGQLTRRRESAARGGYSSF